MARTSKVERAEAVSRLREWVQAGDTIHTVLRHRSASGMSRSIDAYKLIPDGRGPRTIDKLWLSYNVALVGIGTWDSRHEAVKMGGAGMDMGFALVYELSHTLFPEGFGCIGEGCPSNDHSNGDRDYTRHCPYCAEKERPGSTSLHEHPRGRVHWHADGGYALRQDWI